MSLLLTLISIILCIFGIFTITTYPLQLIITLIGLVEKIINRINFSLLKKVIKSMILISYSFTILFIQLFPLIAAIFLPYILRFIDFNMVVMLTIVSFILMISLFLVRNISNYFKNEISLGNIILGFGMITQIYSIIWFLVLSRMIMTPSTISLIDNNLFLVIPLFLGVFLFSISFFFYKRLENRFYNTQIL